MLLKNRVIRLAPRLMQDHYLIVPDSRGHIHQQFLPPLSRLHRPPQRGWRVRLLHGRHSGSGAMIPILNDYRAA
jgi:hypothetical protein